MTSKPWKLCPETWDTIEFQLLHNPICTTRKEKNRKGLLRAGLFVAYRVYRNLVIIYRSEK